MTKLYAVFGGHLPDPSTSGPEEIAQPEFVGLFADKDEARSAWNGASYATIDDAHRRHFLHEVDLSSPENRVEALVNAIWPALTWLKIEGIIDLHPKDLAGFSTLRHTYWLADPLKYPGMPEAHQDAIRSYLRSLPDFDPAKEHKQDDVTLLAHEDVRAILLKRLLPIGALCGTPLPKPVLYAVFSGEKGGSREELAGLYTNEKAALIAAIEAPAGYFVAAGIAESFNWQLAAHIIESLVPTLQWLKQKGELSFVPQDVTDLSSRARLNELADEKLYPDLPVAARTAIQSCLQELKEPFADHDEVCEYISALMDYFTHWNRSKLESGKE